MGFKFSKFSMFFEKSKDNNNNNINMSNNNMFKDIINDQQYMMRVENASVVVKSLDSEREVEFKSMFDSQTNEHSMQHLKNIQLVICINYRDINLLNRETIFKLLEQEAAIGSMMFAVVHESYNQPSFPKDFHSELYQTCVYQYLKTRNNSQDIPVVSITSNSNNPSPFGGNQIHILKLQKENDLMQSSNTNANKSVIAFTEKSRTYATSQVFEKLFGFEFRPGQFEYKLVINNRPVTIFYIALEEIKEDEKCNEECKKRLKDCNRVICLEYCNPRVQVIDQNIRQLKKLDIDIDSVVEFVFYSKKRMDKSEVLGQLDKFLECQYIDYLTERVHLFDEHISLDSIIRAKRSYSDMEKGENTL